MALFFSKQRINFFEQTCKNQKEVNYEINHLMSIYENKTLEYQYENMFNTLCSNWQSYSTKNLDDKILENLTFELFEDFLKIKMKYDHLLPLTNKLMRESYKQDQINKINNQIDKENLERSEKLLKLQKILQINEYSEIPLNVLENYYCYIHYLIETIIPEITDISKGKVGNGNNKTKNGDLEVNKISMKNETKETKQSLMKKNVNNHLQNINDLITNSQPVVCKEFSQFALTLINQRVGIEGILNEKREIKDQIQVNDVNQNLNNTSYTNKLLDQIQDKYSQSERKRSFKMI
ncbi:hypothetical protein M0813_16039 [Anaeramoeba flamelloides]|uniref:Uncharacterized protein n=1 Tax=Anaeramoeba flamelloides TaxID=1746091 RepID=A0ABQ8Z105_9EUKA|nr:hypothetical protein M0813_16039 [Anaeramoeba flamelloides]